jgi:diguanylate cyclase (GGDEF)-like protein
MIDIDHFKRYNDAHGHLQGDVVLREVAQSLRNNIREIDLAARFGGEEFVVLMTKTSKEGARAAAEKLRLCVAEAIFPGTETSQPGGKLTLSLGLAEFPDDSNNATDLLNLADQALYRAKEEGRNRTVAWNSEAPLLPYLSVPPSSQAPTDSPARSA